MRTARPLVRIMSLAAVIGLARPLPASDAAQAWANLSLQARAVVTDTAWRFNPPEGGIGLLRQGQPEPGSMDTPVLAEVGRADKSPWMLRITRRFDGPIHAGTPCVVTVRARLLGTPEKDRVGKVRVNAQALHPPNPPLVLHELTLTPEWRTYLIPFRAKADVPEGQGMVGINLAFREQTLEIGAAQLHVFPVDFDHQVLRALPAFLP